MKSISPAPSQTCIEAHNQSPSTPDQPTSSPPTAILHPADPVEDIGRDTTSWAARLQWVLRKTASRASAKPVAPCLTEKLARYLTPFDHSLIPKINLVRPDDPDFKEKITALFARAALIPGKDFTFIEDNSPGGRFFCIEGTREAFDKTRPWCIALKPMKQLSLSHERALKALREDATRYLANFTDFAPRRVPELRETAHQREVIAAVLARSDGMVIGERHEDQSSKQFVIDNLDTLTDCGVTTLFMEHVLFDQHQPLIDAYLAAPPDATMPKALRETLENIPNIWSSLRGNPHYNFVGLVESAKRAGLKIVAIDCPASYWHYQSGLTEGAASLTHRLRTMNYLATLKIEHRQPRGKWIAFIGSAHCNTFRGVPGVAELTGAPSVIVEDVRTTQWLYGPERDQVVRTHVEDFGATDSDSGINPDIVISCRLHDN